MKVRITSVQTLDDKIYFPGEVEVPEQVGAKLQKQMKAKEAAVAETGNLEAAPMTPQAEGPDVSVGSPIEPASGGSAGSAGNRKGGKKSATGSSDDDEDGE